MKWLKAELEIATRGKGLYSFGEQISRQLGAWRVQQGMCFLYCQHTSASLTINENYDPSARADLETALEKLVPEHAGWYRHDLEGPDDATSHIRSMLTGLSLTIPIDDGQLSLGTWQGIFLFEHRAIPHRRTVLLRVLDMSGD